MGKTLHEIAQDLKNSNKKVQLIYAFNGVGKTRLSRAFKDLVSPKQENEDEESGVKILYYNAFTEDLFYWDNDLDGDTDRKLKIQPNSFTDWVLGDQGQENNIVTNFQHYTNDRLTPRFNEEYTIKGKDGKDVTINANSEIVFSIERGNEEKIENVKISKGEESCLIWCVFYSLLEQVVEVLSEPEPADRDNNQFDDLQYVFIDDPVSSLDENHLIELAVNIAELVKKAPAPLQFIITTHNPLFYNVLWNEFNNVDKRYNYRPKNSERKYLKRLDDGSYILENSKDSPFSYHLFLLSELEKAIDPETGNIQKYHFNFLRNVLEKTSTFLGYDKWEELLPNDSREAYYKRIINLSSHSKHNGEETYILQENDKRVLRYLVRNVIIPTYHFKSSINNNEPEENDEV